MSDQYGYSQYGQSSQHGGGYYGGQQGYPQGQGQYGGQYGSSQDGYYPPAVSIWTLTAFFTLSPSMNIHSCANLYPDC